MSQDNREDASHPIPNLANQLFLVTGASSGIGRATAKEFAAHGGRVVLVARREDRLQSLAEEIRSAGGTAFVAPADLSAPGAARAVADRVQTEIGEIDILVNNAGSGVGGRVWAVADSAKARQFYEVNLWSPLALIGAVTPSMRRRKHGAILNVTSIRIVLPWPSFGHASAAEAALSFVTETLRIELAPYGVAVVEIIPGPIETPALGPSKLLPGFVDAVYGRLGSAQPEELARQIVAAVVEGRPRVFCPEATVRAAYEDREGLRSGIAADARKAAAPGVGLPDGMLDTFVVGGDDPILVQARDLWERDRANR
jgi:short-subunit dehydrogenase